MTDTKSAEQLAGEVKAAFDAQQQAVKKDFDTRHDEVKALAEEALGKAAKLHFRTTAKVLGKPASGHPPEEEEPA